MDNIDRYTISGKGFLTTAGAMTELGRSRFTVQKWCRQGRFMGTEKFGREFLIPEESVIKMKQFINRKALTEVR